MNMYNIKLVRTMYTEYTVEVYSQIHAHYSIESDSSFLCDREHVKSYYRNTVARSQCGRS